MIRIPLALRDIVEWVEYPILLPHVLFDSLVLDHRTYFERLIGKGPKIFWQNVRTTLTAAQLITVHV